MFGQSISRLAGLMTIWSLTHRPKKANNIAFRVHLPSSSARPRRRLTDSVRRSKSAPVPICIRVCRQGFITLRGLESPAFSLAIFKYDFPRIFSSFCEIADCFFTASRDTIHSVLFVRHDSRLGGTWSSLSRGEGPRRHGNHISLPNTNPVRRYPSVFPISTGWQVQPKRSGSAAHGR